MTPSWPERVRAFVERSLRAAASRRWVVAVSGGGDSVGLVRVLHGLAPGLGLELSVAHLDHGARGEAARRDAEFVGELAESLGLPFDLGRWVPKRQAHFEADARRARYDWLLEVARRRDASAVAVGHTRDDQAETILHRMIRGTGPRGLAGIPPTRRLGEGVKLVRPLLDVARDDVRSYLADVGQSFREDVTNTDQSRTRARIRHDLLPRLAADYNPRVVEAIVRLGAISANAERVRARHRLARLARATLESGPERIVLARRLIVGQSAHERAELIRLAWHRAGWPERAMRASHWEQLATLVRHGSGRVSVAGGVEALADVDVLVLRQRFAVADEAPAIVERFPFPVPGIVVWSGGQLVSALNSHAPRDETVDLDTLTLPLEVRAPLPGDRFDPLGMGSGTVGLNDFLRGRRVPRKARGAIPLVCDQKGIVWVAGHRIAHRARVTPQTVRTLGLQWVEAGSDRPPER